MWLIASPVALSTPIRFVPHHPNAMGDSSQRWFCRNQRFFLHASGLTVGDPITTICYLHFLLLFFVLPLSSYSCWNLRQNLVLPVTLQHFFMFSIFIWMYYSSRPAPDLCPREWIVVKNRWACNYVLVDWTYKSYPSWGGPLRCILQQGCQSWPSLFSCQWISAVYRFGCPPRILDTLAGVLGVVLCCATCLYTSANLKTLVSILTLTVSPSKT